jgi:hypothetical protein
MKLKPAESAVLAVLPVEPSAVKAIAGIFARSPGSMTDFAYQHSRFARHINIG